MQRIPDIALSVQVEGQQAAQEAEKDLSASVPLMGGALSSAPVRFMIDIRITGGMRIQQRNLSYEGFEEPGREAGGAMLAERYRHERVLLPAKLP